MQEIIKRNETIPELIITRSEADDWTRRNPHARPGILDKLAARGVILILDGLT